MNYSSWYLMVYDKMFILVVIVMW